MENGLVLCLCRFWCLGRASIGHGLERGGRFNDLVNQASGQREGGLAIP